MANIKITVEDYISYQDDLIEQPEKQKSLARRLIAWSILLLALIAAIYFRQYLALILIACFILLYIWGSTCATKVALREQYEKSRFLNNEVKLSLSERVFKLSIGLNQLTLAVADISLVRELRECFFLSHQSGVILYIPHASLSGEEKAHLQKYRSRFDDGYRDEN